MKISIELIDELRSRVNVSYEEARQTLEKNDGDLIQSIIELENRKGAKENKTVKKTSSSFSDFVNRVLQYKLLVKSNENNVLVNLPLVLVGFVFIMAFWVVIVSGIFGILSGCKFRVYKAKKYANMNEIKENIKHTVSNVRTTTEKIFDNVNVNVNQADDNDDEIIIE